MALILPSRATRIVQPQGPVEFDKSYGLTPIGVFLGSAGAVDIVTGQRFTRGSALAIAPSPIGLGARQNAINTGLHRAVPELQSVSDYTAIWHGVPIGAPVGSTPAFVGLANSASSQSAGALAIEYTSTTQLQVSFRSSTAGSTRTGSFTWANVYGKAVTLIASYSADEDFVRLRICYDGMVQDVVASAVSAGAPPTLLGTEQFVVGPDVVEQPSRHINAHVGFAGVFYGRLRGGVVQSVLRSPWQLFKPASRSIIVDLGAGGGPVGGNASATPAPLTTTPATATATGAAIAAATPAPVSATPAQATAAGGAAAQATPAPLTISAAQAAATGAAQAAATPAPVQLSPATATASGASGGEVVASSTPAPVGLSAPTATATGGASAQAMPAPITTTAPTASVGSGASASATLAALGLMPATGTATGGAAASAVPAQIIIAPAAGSAKGGAQAYSTPAQIIITPATGTGSDGAAESITWPATAATATVPRASLVAVVPAAQFAAYVLRTNHTAIAPPTGDDMQPITTFEQYTSDREIYNINFAARYMPEGDAADRLLAIGHDPGVTVTTQVPVGGAVPSGVVFFAVDDPIAPGDYKVWVQISTVAGREVTRAVIVNASTV